MTDACCCEYSLFPDCIPIRGYGRSVVYDLLRCDYVFIPNVLCDILLKYNGFPYGYLKGIYAEDLSVLNEYMDLLIERELVFYSKCENLFVPITITRETASLINDIVIDNSFCFKHDYEKLSSEVDSLGCHSMVLRFYDFYALDYIKSVLSFFRETVLRDIVVLIQYSKEYSLEELKKLVDSENRISKLIVVSSVRNRSYKYKETLITFVSYEFDEDACCGKVDMNRFSVNMNMFLDSKLYNNCLYKKISVDKFGMIKNCPSSVLSYGHYKDRALIDAVSDIDFKKMWYIKKDDVQECMYCEFRYMCQDCRIFLKDANNLYSKPLKCNYNIYKCRWKK